MTSSSRQSWTTTKTTTDLLPTESFRQLNSLMKLILKEDSWSNATAFFLEDLYREHFELTTDLSNDGIVYAHCQDWEWAKSLNRPAIIDHLWEYKDFNPDIQETDQIKVIHHDDWFFLANECLWYDALGYQDYIASNVNDRDFLMFINKKKDARDQIWKATEDLRKNSFASYQGIGVPMYGDIDRNLGEWQRYLNTDWYDRTKYSLVVETRIDEIFITEKVLKPLAFGHPFIVWGAPGILARLRKLGFETFDNCIDESYDLEEDNDKRLTMIIEEVARLNATPKDYFLDQETQRRIDTNHDRFYNSDWATQQFEKYFEQIKQRFDHQSI